MPSRIFDIGMLSLIFLNVVAVVIGSVQSVQARFGTFLSWFEAVSVIVFSAEYLVRLWACTADDRFWRGFASRVNFALRPMSVIDLLAVIPFYLPFVGVDLRTLRVLRLFRILRVAKAGRYCSSLTLIKRVLCSKKEELILTTALMAVLLIMSSTLLYHAENEGQPEAFSSIPATMWWAVATLTTVGYGDMYPLTAIGKLFAGVIAILGVGMFALPTGILGAGFVDAIHQAKDPQAVCPHCGGRLDHK